MCGVIVYDMQGLTLIRVGLLTRQMMFLLVIAIVGGDWRGRDAATLIISAVNEASAHARGEPRYLDVMRMGAHGARK